MSAPNIIVILADDLGFSDLGCYGGEIATPNLDRLAQRGVRLTQFYNTARCSPSRASLLTGRHPHETGIGVLTDDGRPLGYAGTMSSEFPTIAERLKPLGYRTALTGKWHLSADTKNPNDSWPTRRGFDEFYGILAGAGDYFSPRGLFDGEERLEVPHPDEYYFTDAVTDRAVDFVQRSVAADDPYFLYLAYTAPHWPLHAPEESIGEYESLYAQGWDALRAARSERQRADGLLGEEAALSLRDLSQPAWDDVSDAAWEARRMAVYAAQVEIMDRGIGRVLDEVDRSGTWDDTIIVFLSDNGACAESLPPEDAPLFRQRNPKETITGKPMQIGNEPAIWPGPADTYASYGRAWANLSNTPFRLYKRWIHEGGISTPFIASWPKGDVAGGRLATGVFQLTDIAPTLIAAAGGEYDGPGTTMLPVLAGDAERGDHPLFWEHIGNAGVRRGSWKAVRTSSGPWELYDIDRDRSELVDLARDNPDELAELVGLWQEWADGVGVIPWERIKEQAK